MKKEELMKLGLDDEQAGEVIHAWDSEIKEYVPKAEHIALESAKGGLETRLNDVEKLVTGLVKDSKGSTLEEKISAFQLSVQTAKDDYEQQLKDTRTAAAIKLELSGKVHDYELVSGLINTEKLAFDEKGNITAGLKEQIEGLRKDKAFLFAPNEPEVPKFKGIRPGEPKDGIPDARLSGYEARLAEARKNGNTLEAIKVKQEAANENIILV